MNAINALVFAVLQIAATAALAAPLTGSEAKSTTQAYLDNVFSSDARTLRNHYEFESAATEYEERLIAACERREPLPAIAQGACAERLRAGGTDQTPSMYLVWVRKRLPNPPHRLAVQRVERIDQGTPFEGDLVVVVLNGVSLKFFRHDDQTGTGPNLGRYSLVSIGGVQVVALIERDLRKAKCAAAR